MAGRSIGAGVLFAGLGSAFFRGSGLGSTLDSGAVAATGMGASTDRLFTTVLIPGTWEISAAASERAASLLTLPFSVTIPF
jgi:hypothetical protein